MSTSPMDATIAAAHPPRVWQPDEFLYFGSGVGIRELSNFSAAKFVLPEGVFPSSEHAYQAIQKFEPEEWPKFQVRGELSTIDSLGLFYKPDVAQKKMGHWNKHRMIGIAPKMASNPAWAKKLKLRMRKHNPEAEHMHLSAIKPLFKRILLAKYRQNSTHCAKLLGTGDKHLIEFGRGSKREALAGRSPMWTALVDKETGILYGDNLMGGMMMEVRDILRAEEQ